MSMLCYYPRTHRLYETVRGYVTKKELAARILRGESFQIHEFGTDRDLTGYMLLRMLSELARAGDLRITTAALHELLRKPARGKPATASKTLGATP